MKKVICAGAIITKKKKFLLGKRSKNKKWAPGKWDIVGGKAKKNESPEEACFRETLEETGIIIRKHRLIKNFLVPEERDAFRYFIFFVETFSGKAKNLSKEHSKLGWFTLKQLGKKKLAHPMYLDVFRECV